VDEAGMVDSRLMGKLHERLNGAKLILVGDSKQLQPVKAGALFAGLWNKNGGAEMKDIQRQKVAWQKEASVAFSNLDTSKGLKAYEENGCVTIEKNQVETMKSMVKDWSKRRDDLQNNVMLAGTRKEVSKLNLIARDQLQSQGKLGKEIKANTAYGKQAFAINDRVLFKKNNKDLFNAKNGELGTVKKVSYNKAGNPIITIAKDNGSNVTFNLKDYGNITHGYAITTHASQGISVNKTSVLLGNFNGKEMSYVQFTRHKQECKIYSDKETLRGRKLSELLNKTMAKDNISDFQAQVNKTESLRRSFMQTLKEKVFKQPKQAKVKSKGRSLELTL